MAKRPCKAPECKKQVNIPPNRLETATGYCRACYFDSGKHHKKALRNHGPDGRFTS